jgi:hypothetical protein
MRHTELEPRFVKVVPRELEPGILYVSMEYGTVVHSCCCGCGHEVVTPLTPTDWNLNYDGEGISLWPSVGNWNLPCQSHYIIDRNRVVECGRWSKEKIEAELNRDRTAKAKFYAAADTSGHNAHGAYAEAKAKADHHNDEQGSFRSMLRRWFG